MSSIFSNSKNRIPDILEYKEEEKIEGIYETGQGSPVEAVHAATQGLQNPSMILFIAPYHMAADIAIQLRKQYPDTPSIGTIGTKLTNGQVSDDTLAVLALFDDAKVRCGVMERISQCPVSYSGEIRQKIDQISPGREDTVCIEYCTGSEEKLVTTFTSFFEKKGIRLAGGTVFGVPDGKAPIVAYNGQVYEDACVYAIIKNTTGRVKVYKENIYQKNSIQSHFATKVNVAKKELIELDGRPAADVYSSELGIPRSQIVDNVLVNPMGRAVGDQVFLSSFPSTVFTAIFYMIKKIIFLLMQRIWHLLAHTLVLSAVESNTTTSM